LGHSLKCYGKVGRFFVAGVFFGGHCRQIASLYCEEYGAGVMNLTTRQFASLYCEEYGAGVMNLTTRQFASLYCEDMEQELRI
jgi:hypothetical protein